MSLSLKIVIIMTFVATINKPQNEVFRVHFWLCCHYQSYPIIKIDCAIFIFKVMHARMMFPFSKFG